MTLDRDHTWAIVLAGGGSVAEAFRRLPSADFSRDILQRATGLAALAMPNVGWNDWGTPVRVLASLRGRPAEGHLLTRLARGSMSEVVA